MLRNESVDHKLRTEFRDPIDSFADPLPIFLI